MTYCSCGNTAHNESGRCARCAALLTLGLEAGASEEEIRSAYHLLVKVWHPDRFQADSKTRTQAEEKLKSINEAYRTLRQEPPPGPRRRSPQAAPPPVAPEPVSQQPPEDVQPSSATPAPHARPALLRRFAILAFVSLAVVVVFWLVSQPVDAYLTSNPMTAEYYGAARAKSVDSLQQLREETWDRAELGVRNLFGGSSSVTPGAARQPGSQFAHQRHRERPPDALAGSTTTEKPIRLLPYITAGLTQNEVIAVQGPPTSASASMLFYGKSELDFSQGKLSGWKIDPASPLRVKLWPDAPVDPDLESFTVGSPKNVVLVVQGTPTFFSANTFGYGASQVYFQDDRVVGWKSAPGSVPLRAVVR